MGMGDGNFVKNALLILKNNCVPGQILALSRPEIDKFPAMDTMAGKMLTIYRRMLFRTVRHP